MNNLIVSIGAAVGVALLLATVKANPKIHRGKTIIQYGLPLKGFCIFSLEFALLLTYLSIHSENDLILRILLPTCALLGALILNLEFFVVKISYDETTLYATSPWRKSRAIPWSDVQSLDYSTVMQWHVIDTNEHGVVRVPDFLSGKEALFEEIRKRVG